MSNRPSKTVVVATSYGACVGVLLAAPFWSVVGRHLASAPILVQIWAIAGAPASWLGDIWTHQLKLPPHGEMAWAVPPAVATVLLWTLMGFLIGLWRIHKLKRKVVISAGEKPGVGIPPKQDE